MAQAAETVLAAERDALVRLALTQRRYYAEMPRQHYRPQLAADGRPLLINDRVVNRFGHVLTIGRGEDEHGYLPAYTEDGFLRWEHASDLRHVEEAA